MKIVTKRVNDLDRPSQGILADFEQQPGLQFRGWFSESVEGTPAPFVVDDPQAASKALEDIATRSLKY